MIGWELATGTALRPEEREIISRELARDEKVPTVSIHGLTVKRSCGSVLGLPGVAGQGAGDGVQDG